MAPGDYQKLFEDPVFAAYVFYAIIAIAKMTFVQWWTTVVRVLNKVSSASRSARVDVVGMFRIHPEHCT